MSETLLRLQISRNECWIFIDRNLTIKAIVWLNVIHSLHSSTAVYAMLDATQQQKWFKKDTLKTNRLQLAVQIVAIVKNYGVKWNHTANTILRIESKLYMSVCVVNRPFTKFGWDVYYNSRKKKKPLSHLHTVRYPKTNGDSEECSVWNRKRSESTANLKVFIIPEILAVSGKVYTSTCPYVNSDRSKSVPKSRWFLKIFVFAH